MEANTRARGEKKRWRQKPTAGQPWTRRRRKRAEDSRRHSPTRGKPGAKHWPSANRSKETDPRRPRTRQVRTIIWKDDERRGKYGRNTESETKRQDSIGQDNYKRTDCEHKNRSGVVVVVVGARWFRRRRRTRTTRRLQEPPTVQHWTKIIRNDDADRNNEIQADWWTKENKKRGTTTILPTEKKPSHSQTTMQRKWKDWIRQKMPPKTQYREDKGRWRTATRP